MMEEVGVKSRGVKAIIIIIIILMLLPREGVERYDCFEVEPLEHIGIFFS